MVFGLSVVSLPALPPIVGIVVLVWSASSPALLYLRHARRTADPILDFRLFRNPVFRAAITGGSLFRIGSGATPFLLPLLFQLGFGMTPFQSGMLTFASAFGALAMKFLAPFTLRAGGFRNVLIVRQRLLAAASSPPTRCSRRKRRTASIIAVLIGAGFLRSLFFTSANALVFADIDDKDASQATAISAASQQISGGDRRRGRRRHPRRHDLPDRRADRRGSLLDRLRDRRIDHRACVDPVSAACPRMREVRCPAIGVRRPGRRRAAAGLALTRLSSCP